LYANCQTFLERSCPKTIVEPSISTQPKSNVNSDFEYNEIISKSEIEHQLETVDHDVEQLLSSMQSFIDNRGSNIIDTVIHQHISPLNEHHHSNKNKAFQQFNQVKFIHNDQTIELNGINFNDSITSKIESLRLFLENKLGIETFLNVYQLITKRSSYSKQTDLQIRQILNTNEKYSYLKLIVQLVECEAKCFN